MRIVRIYPSSLVSPSPFLTRPQARHCLPWNGVHSLGLRRSVRGWRRLNHRSLHSRYSSYRKWRLIRKMIELSRVRRSRPRNLPYLKGEDYRSGEVARAIRLITCQRPLYLPDTAVIDSVQVRLKTRPWAGRPVFTPEAVGHERVRLQRTSRWLTHVNASFDKLEPKWSQVL